MVPGPPPESALAPEKEVVDAALLKVAKAADAALNLVKKAAEVALHAQMRIVEAESQAQLAEQRRLLEVKLNAELLQLETAADTAVRKVAKAAEVALLKVAENAENAETGHLLVEKAAQAAQQKLDEAVTVALRLVAKASESALAPEKEVVDAALLKVAKAADAALNLVKKAAEVAMHAQRRIVEAESQARFAEQHRLLEVKLNAKLEEKVRERTEELREKDLTLLIQSRQAAMGEMIGNIAHQWRQPLNLLGLTVQQFLCYYDLGELDRTFLAENVGKAMELIQHMSKTIDDFRNYFKPDKEKIDFKVQKAIANTLTLLEGSLQAPKISVEVVAKEDLVIHGFANEFTQVLLNIVINARDALIEREIDDPKVTIMIFSEASYTVVTVADNAGGIPEEIVDKIFNPYFTTKGPQGTGVGLFMSKSIIEKNMGGRLTVRNIAGGTEFRIEVCNGIDI